MNGAGEPSKHFTVEDLGHELIISWRWYGCAVWALAVFALIWDSFLVFFYMEAIQKGDLIMFLFPVLHLAAGVAITYFTLAMFLNSTRIEVGLDHLRVRHGPLPWKGQHDLRATDVKQLHCQERIHRGKNNSISYTYEVHADVRGMERDERIVLLRGLGTKEHALELEKLIEKHLGIKDQRVEGQIEP